MIWLALILGAEAQDLQVNGDVKSFFIAGFPYDHLLMMEDDYGQSFLDTRLKIRAKLLPNIKLVAHHAVTMGTATPPSNLSTELAALGQELEGEMSSGFMTGVGLQAPEAIDLSWTAFEDSFLILHGRTDRLYLELSVGNAEIRLGRQPISFGYGMAFNPLDLIQPFGVATIDAEYKPGVDAFRTDIYIGMASQITAVAAYVGDWNREGMIFAVNGKTTLGMTECSLFAASVRGDSVFGAGVSGSLGPVGVYGDATVTLPYEEEDDVFIRAEIGSLWKPFGDTTITAEAYVQTNGAESPEDYLTFASEDPRFARGEIWLMGQYYGTLGISQQLTPLLGANVATTANFLDPSAMISAGLSYSIADNSELYVGGFYGLGQRPDELTITDLFLDPNALAISSEFGFYPTMFFAQLRAYI
ncbi:MAG: hypothetical protein VX278_04375 [Myxococcota bacterium]|nr:hypothetical protein [Myxococcota bacterium]